MGFNLWCRYENETHFVLCWSENWEQLERLKNEIEILKTKGVKRVKLLILEGNKIPLNW